MFVQVPLGVLMKREQTGEDMVDIMMHLHKYVPQKQQENSILSSLEEISSRRNVLLVPRTRSCSQLNSIKSLED